MNSKNIDSSFRRPLLLGFMQLVVIAGLWHGTAELMFGVNVLAFLELGLTLYYGALLVVVWRRDYSSGLALAVVLPFLAIMLMAMSHEETPAKVFIWLFVVPVLSYTLLGKWPGFIVTLTVSTLAFCAYSYRYSHDVEMYGFLTMSDSIICMSIVWGAMHLYERNREKTASMLHQMATTDELTGFHNRRQMTKSFEHLSAAAERNNQVLAVVVMDLDHFKQVNDTWGHDAGDAVLRHAATIVKDNLRRSDWAFRTGGEEFCLLITADNAEAVVRVAEGLRVKVCESPCSYENTSIAITASIGLSVCPAEGGELEGLQKLADKRMYKAKEGGRNRVVADNA